jgi:hypothetical protein
MDGLQDIFYFFLNNEWIYECKMDDIFYSQMSA